MYKSKKKKNEYNKEWMQKYRAKKKAGKEKK